MIAFLNVPGVIGVTKEFEIATAKHVSRLYLQNKNKMIPLIVFAIAWMLNIM